MPGWTAEYPAVHPCIAACWLLAPAPTSEPLRSPAATAPRPRSFGGTYCDSATAAPATAATPTASASFLRADTRVLRPRARAGRPGATLGVAPGPTDRHTAAALHGSRARRRGLWTTARRRPQPFGVAEISVGSVRVDVYAPSGGGNPRR